ncbi:MAG TPA: hypothetical protein VK840_05815 [Candidatus Dormibacteraeota bacterium]|nr:hypothetical protein [Candidatus Dormibacteraeota bacterium]
MSGNCFAAIVYPKEPDGGRQMVIQFANYFVGKNLPPFKGISTTNDLTFAPPLQEYGSGDLAKGQLLTGATSGRDGLQIWKYIFMHGTNVVGDAYLEADENTRKPLKCTSLGNDVFSEETLKALQAAEQLPLLQKQDYEARLLDDRLVSFDAVWLHGRSNDIIIPLPPTYNRMNAYQLYSESQIIKILAPEARRDITMWAKLEKQRQKDNDAYVKAMTDYEKAHGGKCGPISFYGISSPFQNVESNVQIFTLQGMSSECGKVSYKVEVTYERGFNNVKQVEVLEKIAPSNNP